jgi:hypothetical protein
MLLNEGVYDIMGASLLEIHVLCFELFGKAWLSIHGVWVVKRSSSDDGITARPWAHCPHGYNASIIRA